MAVAADSPNRSSRLLLPRCVRLGSRSCAASESTPRFAGSTTPGIQARPFVDAPRQEALNDSGAPHFGCRFEWLSKKQAAYRLVQAAVDTTGEHACASSGKVHPAMDGPAPATLREAQAEQARFRALPSVASRFDAVAP